jgi:hypothetical protein
MFDIPRPTTIQLKNINDLSYTQNKLTNELDYFLNYY